MTQQFQENAALSEETHLSVYHHLTGDEVYYSVAHLTSYEIEKIRNIQLQNAAEKLIDATSDKIVMFWEDMEGRPTFYPETMKKVLETQKYNKIHPTNLAIHYQ